MSQRWVKVRNWIAVIGVLVASLGLVVLTQGKPAQAAGGAVEKSKLYALSQCYTNSFNQTIYTQSWYGIDSLDSLSGSYFVYNPSANLNDYTTMMKSCYEIADMFSRKVPGNSASASEVNTFLEDIGYSQNGNVGAGSACAHFTFGNGSKTSTAIMCAPTTTGNENGAITSNKVTVDWRGETRPVQFELGKGKVTPDCKVGGLGKGGCSTVTFTQNSTTLRTLAIGVQDQIKTGQAKNNGKLSGGWALTSLSFAAGDVEQRVYTKGTSTNKVISYFSGGQFNSVSQLVLNKNEMVDLLYGYMTKDIKFVYFMSDTVACKGALSEADRNTALQQGYTRVSLTSSLTCWIKPVNDTLSVPGYTGAGGNRNYFNGTPFDAETVMSELNRLNGLPEEEIIEDPKEDCNNKFNDTLRAIRNLLNDSHISGDYRKKLKAAEEEIQNILSTHGQYWYEENGVVICYDLPDIGPPSDDDDEEDPGTTPPPDANDPSNGSDPASGGSDITQCLNQAGALGWILCPVLSIVKNAAEKFYDNLTEDWLPIDANLVSNNSGIYEGWKVFRNIANIIFTIMLMVILFSQITGVGVSNYGIKKMLPSLIIVAVLVNISFLICQLAVDVTNIVGAEIGNILSSIGGIGTSGGTATEVTGATVIKGAIGVIFSFAGVGAAAVAVTLNPGFLILVLISGIGVLISMFFFFAILALRKAAVYICIIIAPLAIIFYALPNTKSLYDRWKKLFMATLIVYPVCQAITGAGQMISQMMLADENGSFVYNIVAVILSFAPVFFIPSIVSNSLAGLGNLGAKVSQLGRRASAGTTRFARNTDLAKRAQVAGANLGATRGRELVGRINNRLRNMRGVGRVVRGIEDSTPGRALSARNTRRAAEAMQAYRKMRLGDGEAQFIAKNMDIDRDLAAQEYRQQQDMISNAEQTFRQDGVSYDGNTANVNNIDDTIGALDYYGSLYDRDQSNTEASTNMQALTSILMESGDPGRSAVMNWLKDHNFDETSGKARGTASFSKLTDYINRNQKWMGGLKGADRGSFNMVADGAKGDIRAMQSLWDYNMGGTQNIAPNGEAIHNLGDSFYDGITKASAAGMYSGVAGRDNRKQLKSVYNAFRIAMSNPVTAQGVTAKDIINMNKIVAALKREGESVHGFALNDMKISHDK